MFAASCLPQQGTVVSKGYLAEPYLPVVRLQPDGAFEEVLELQPAQWFLVIENNHKVYLSPQEWLRYKAGDLWVR